MKSFGKLTLVALAVSSLTLSGCATHTLLSKDSGGMRTEKVKKTLVSDTVLAFGKPSLRLSNLPADAVVIVGQKHSYVLTEGGGRFERLLTHLDPKNIKVTKPLNFYSANNDGSFTGSLAFKYTKLKDDVKKDEVNFFIQNGVEECTSHSEKQLNAQSFCFEIPLKGLSYPVVTNQASLQTLSRAYPVTIYTHEEKSTYQHGDSNPVQKLVLFPFAVAFDVVTLPFQALNKIFD
ncbi:hypothetical protein [Moraxella sp. VT-16-12]|uniref:hypothetical protein n=1 Tax=Moraxella sp. VT-16-12 TaxID=2014877 RepID=UPI000B7C9BE7|nr:hypothetical protein [Moraxella sp. VT-16-12]TWV81999.1 hypothetical protein CEW93_006875 [Moraxella sp. VT-16-12]